MHPCWCDIGANFLIRWHEAVETVLCSAERTLLLPEVPPESIENCGAVHVHYNQYFTSISINKCVQNCVKLDCAIAVCLNIEMIHE